MNNIKLKQFLLEMKQEILNKLAENRCKIREIKNELKAAKQMVNDVGKATSNHIERLDKIEQEKFPELKCKVDKKVTELQEKLFMFKHFTANGFQASFSKLNATNILPKMPMIIL